MCRFRPAAREDSHTGIEHRVVGCAIVKSAVVWRQLRDRRACRKCAIPGKTGPGHSSCAWGGRKAATAPVMVLFDGVPLRNVLQKCQRGRALAFFRSGWGVRGGRRVYRCWRQKAQAGRSVRRFGIPCCVIRNRIRGAVGRKEVQCCEVFRRRRLPECAKIGRFRVKVYKLTKLLCKSGNYSYICTLYCARVHTRGRERDPKKGRRKEESAGF